MFDVRIDSCVISDTSIDWGSVVSKEVVKRGEGVIGRGEVKELVAKQAEACFILPLREAIAHFARRDSRPTETEVGGSDYGNAHSSTDVSANLRVGFLPLLGKQAG
jgi:hypothetical protein